MYIPTLAFQKFYELLENHAWENELTPEQRKVQRHQSTSVWDTPKKDEGVTVFVHMFGKFATDHLSQKLSEYNTTDRQEAFINDDLAIKAFAHLKIRRPLPIRKRTIDKKIDAQILLQIFLEKYFSDIIASTEDKYLAYNHKAGKIITGRRVLRKYTKKSSETILDEKVMVNKNTNDIVSLVENYYQNNNATGLREAWELISEETRIQRWNNEFNSFQKGYINTKNVFNVNVWSVQINGSFASCKVYYDDEVEVCSFLDLGNVDAIKISQLASFSSKIENLRKSMSAKKVASFDKIELARLFDLNVHEYTWYKCGINASEIEDLVTSPKTYKIPRLIYITCKNIGGQWFIQSFAPIKSEAIT